ncbi:MAG: hypothetical protein P0Y63_10405 [Klebsiella huaxiensis]|uniref:hypothetical protein n=1 Tax=Klebsiella huaxiensis TaxID=2153354 RepID=UPI0026ED42F9|nr:hypothetical protein [Klebsiella huaxiensis]WEJ91408.1 MAG: hypothetical protein P0Y63_10405 [Klebsiella huaxiensis]
MFYFRINRVRILDNHKNAFLFFGDGYAQVKLISFITSDSDIPILDAWYAEKNEEIKKQLLIQAVQQVASARVFNEVDNVKDNSVLTFGDTGYVLYSTPNIPENFNWCLTVIKDDKNINDIGMRLESVIMQPDFDIFAANLGTIILGTVNPAFAAGVIIAKFLTNVVATTLKNNPDDQLGLLYMSLNKQEHYRYGERKRDGIPDLSGNIRVDYSIFAFK